MLAAAVAAAVGAIMIWPADGDAYFESIRGDRAMAQEFFRQMPKGADLHNHLPGNIDPGTLISEAIRGDFCATSERGYIVERELGACPDGSRPVSDAETDVEFGDFLKRQWSVHGFDAAGTPSAHDHFFAIFDRIRPVTEDTPALLGHWRQTMQEENLQYAEVMLFATAGDSEIGQIAGLVAIDGAHSLEGAYDTVAGQLEERGTVQKNAAEVARFDAESSEICAERIGTCDVEVRYISQILRTAEPELLFASMVAGFELARASDLVVAVNMVGSESDAATLEDYALQMEMLGYIGGRYPDVGISLHAGELWPTLDNVAGRDLGFHIYEAITVGGAQRIGHGVTVEFELEEHPQLIDIMRDTPVPVEINLSSNYFILQIEPQDHPILFYLRNGVPLVLSDDDPGILLTSMSNEFATAARNYPDMKYSDFKDMAYNSIRYSFADSQTKSEMIDRLDAGFAEFEKRITGQAGAAVAVR